MAHNHNPIRINPDALNDLSEAAGGCDGDMEDRFFRERVLPSLARYAAAELYFLAGMLVGHGCVGYASVVADYAQLAFESTLPDGRGAPDPVAWLREREAARDAAQADDAADLMPF